MKAIDGERKYKRIAKFVNDTHEPIEIAFQIKNSAVMDGKDCN